MIDTIAAALASLKQAAEASLHHPVECLVISLPEAFNVPTVAKAAMAAGFAFSPTEQPVQIIRFANAVHSGYNLGSCEGLGLEPNCDFDQSHMIFWIDYTSASLDLRAFEVSEHGVFPYRHLRFPDLGDKILGVSFEVSPPRTYLHLELSPRSTSNGYGLPEEKAQE